MKKSESICIDLSGTTETVKLWFERLFKTELDETIGTIDNCELWVKGSSGEEKQMFKQNIVELKEYKSILKSAAKQAAAIARE